MPVMISPPGPHAVFDGRQYLYFGGTAYLGLQQHPDVIHAACDALQQYGVGSATSRGGFGDTPPVLEVEHQAARWFATEGAFYYASGYLGNQILLTASAGTFDAVFVDECAHYCVFEAARLSQQPVFAFPHADPDGLQAAIQKHLPPGGCPLVASDGVFAALGHVAPADRYCDVLRAYPGSALLLDDAHGIGVLGTNGWGTWEHFGLDDRVNAAFPGDDDSPLPSRLLCGTLSKAVGGFGGLIPGRETFIQRVKCTPYFAGASAPPIAVAAATARALQIVQDEPQRRAQLQANVRAVRDGLIKLGLPADDVPVPIFCLPVGDAQNMQRLHQQLKEHGILVPYLPAYSGLGQHGALRLAVFATHTADMIAQLLDDLARSL